MAGNTIATLLFASDDKPRSSRSGRCDYGNFLVW